MLVECSGCHRQDDVDLPAIHEPDRICFACKHPWQPAGYKGQLVTEETTITPSMAYGQLNLISDHAGHWTLSRPEIATRYANMLRSGQWEHRGLDHPDGLFNPVTWDPHGVLLIGVVRLLAIVESGVPMTCIVRHFTPVVDGHVPFDARMHFRKVPRLLSHWHYLREVKAHASRFHSGTPDETLVEQ